ARAGGAGLIHREIDHHAALDRDVFRVLAADLEDGVDRFTAERAADVDGAGLVGGDLVVDRVGADELGGQLAAGAGGSGAGDIEAAAPNALDFGEPLLHGFDRAAGGAEVDVVDDRAHVVDQDDVGRDGADVEAEVGGDGLGAGRRNVDGDAVAQLDDVLGGKR